MIRKQSNCFLWAGQKWMEKGGYLCLRKSRVWWGWHVLWIPDEGMKLQHFIPAGKEALRQIPWYRIDLLLWFKGVVKVGDTLK